MPDQDSEWEEVHPPPSPPLGLAPRCTIQYDPLELDDIASRFDKYVRLDYCGGRELPEEMRDIVMTGFRVPGDHGMAQDVKPDWYDADLFLEGQRCARNYSVGLAQGELLSLFLLFAVPTGVDPLIATGRSETPETAGKRYLSTARRLMSWYSTDLFDPSSPAWADLVTVRKLHASIRKTCNQSTPEQLAVKFTVGKEQPQPLRCPLTPFLQGVFRELPCAEPLEVEVDRYRRPFLSQGEMAITQFGFFGLFILQPELFGAPYITRRELEGLVHLWEVIGFCLGIEDRFNFCRGGLDVTLKRCEMYVRSAVVPNFRKAGAEWEHMTRCMVEGMSAKFPMCSFEANLAYMLEDVMHLRTVIPKSLSWWQTLQLWRLRLMLQYLPRLVPSMSRWLSQGMHWLLVK